MWRDRARVQSMQSKTHEALHNLRRALAVYDGLDHSTELLEVAQHWQNQSGVTGRLAKEMPRMPDGVPVDLLLNILDNVVVRHCHRCLSITSSFCAAETRGPRLYVLRATAYSYTVTQNLSSRFDLLY